VYGGSLEALPNKRLREELTKRPVEVKEDKSRRVDLQQGESFGFLGFEFRRVGSRRRRWMPLLWLKGKKRTAWLDQLREISTLRRVRTHVDRLDVLG